MCLRPFLHFLRRGGVARVVAEGERGEDEEWIVHGRYTCNTPHRLILSPPLSMTSLSTLCCLRLLLVKLVHTASKTLHLYISTRSRSACAVRVVVPLYGRPRVVLSRLRWAVRESHFRGEEEGGYTRLYLFSKINASDSDQDATPHGRRATPLGHLLHRPAGQEAARRWQGILTLCLRFLRFLRLLVGFSSGGPSPSALLSARRRQRR